MTEPRLFAEIVFPIPLNKHFTYEIPENLQGLIQEGSRVIAPLGSKKTTGYITRLLKTSDGTKCLFISDVLDLWPVFSAELLSLAQWIAEYYMTPVGLVLDSMLPPGMDRRSEKIFTLTASIGEYEIQTLKKAKPVQSKILKALLVYKQLSLKALVKKVGSKNLAKNIDELKKLQIISEQDVLHDSDVNIRFEKYVRFSPALTDEPERIDAAMESLEKRSPKQAELLAYLKSWTEERISTEEETEIRQSDLLQVNNAPLSALKGLSEKKLVVIFEKEKIRNPYDFIPDKPRDLTLNAEQKNAVDIIDEAIQKREYKTFLLHGVTGSGKTQVYIESIKRVLELGKTAIVLVPEISLTPQAVQRFKAHFGELVAVLHSRMSMGERFDSWRKLQSGDYKIVIGARSAIFAPMQNPGLIVIDEEHENTYKQSDSAPKYHARDNAVIRGNLNKAVVILGSATPSIESYYNAQSGKYTLLELTKRIDGVPMPKVEIVNLRNEKNIHTERWKPVFSRPLREAMQMALRHKQQIILFQNRRGYANYVECYDCGFIGECPHCSITLTFHSHQFKLRCHYCGHTIPAYRECPSCGNANILNHGIGTQKVEEQLKDMFGPDAVVRMDLDTTGTKGAHGKILEKFQTGEAPILLGTQMVAKGLDFENVTVVGVISADTSLLLPDFRSSEKTFQLLTQVAGRAGRKDKLGRVFIQTYNPKRSAIVFAQNHDYASFYKEEIAFRRELMYPPFGRLVLIQFKSQDEKKVVEHAGHFCDILRDEIGRRLWAKNQFDLMGPVSAPIAKIRNHYRWQILIKVSKSFDKSGVHTRRLISDTLSRHDAQYREAKVQIGIEMDPYSLL
ncbi:primosomal protein N' [bacterium]|nr:primosomal protein N' [bacterium]